MSTGTKKTCCLWYKADKGLHTFTAYGRWGEKMVLDLFVKIAALGITLWFYFMYVEEEEEEDR